MTALVLFTKCSLILLATALVYLAMRRQSAAALRLVWLTGLSATLLLPLGAWLPKTRVSLPTIVISAGPSNRTAHATAIDNNVSRRARTSTQREMSRPCLRCADAH